VHESNRATRSAALLAGFWLVAWGQVVAALVLVLLVLAMLPAAVALRIGAPLCIATAGLLWFATSRALRVRHPTPAGVPVSRTDAPALWSLIDAAASAAQAAPPDGVTVIADARVWVGERFRLTGLLGGRRELYLGLPLLQAWDVGRLRAVAAHELAHSSTELGRFAPMAYRGRLAVARIVRRMPRRSPAGPVLRAYARMYRRLDAPFAWAQELAADRAAAAFAGPPVAAAVLRDGPALEAVQQLFHAEYLSSGWQAGFVPEDVFGGLLRVLAARPEEMARLRSQPPPAPVEGDPHPPLADRLTALTALETASAAPKVAPAPGPAAELVPDLPGLGRALQAVAFPSAGRTVVDWDEFFSVTRNAEMEREADAALRSIGHAVGAPVPGLAAVLDLVADGRLPKAAEVVFAGRPPAEVAGRTTELITLLLALAALRSGAARWRHSWSGTAELVAIDGSYLDVAEPATLAADPVTVDQARTRLADLGIDLVAAARPDPDRRPARVPIHGGVVNVLADGARTDVLILETGLLLITALPRSRNGDARRRLARLAAAGIHADGALVAAPRASDLLSAALLAPTGLIPTLSASSLSAVDAGVRAEGGRPAVDRPSDGSADRLAGNRFLPFGDVTRAAVMQGRRRQWELTTAGGSVLTLRTTLDSDELHGGWSALDEAVAFLTRTRMPAPARDQADPSAPTASLEPSDSHRAEPTAPSTTDHAAPFAPPAVASGSRGPVPVPSASRAGAADSARSSSGGQPRDLATSPTSGGPFPAPTSGAH
jgi:hypothetical protein